MNLEINNKYIFASLSVVTFFVFIVTSSAIYIQENYSVTKSCGCETSIYLIIIALASLGLFSGTLTYYFHSKSIEKKFEKKDLTSTLKFLEKNERKIIENLIHNKGWNYQNKISKETGIDSVKTHRILKNLEQREIIKKEDSSMTKIVELKEDIYEVFK